MSGLRLLWNRTINGLRQLFIDYLGIGNIIINGIDNSISNVSTLETDYITINENADPDVGRDFFRQLERIVPSDASYHHSEGNSDSHVKASLVGLSAQVPVRGGQCVLGTWQSIYFCEFDGPRSRRVSVTCIGE